MAVAEIESLAPRPDRRQRRLKQRRLAVRACLVTWQVIAGGDLRATVGIVTAAVNTRSRAGLLLREWRKRHRLSQLELALDAGISARHLSFIETGRSRPSAQMLLLLAEQLEIPFRERNHLLLAGGYAPAFPQRSLEDPELTPVREALDLILTGHEPYPAVVLDRYWNVVAGNAAMGAVAALVDEDLLEPPLNAMRVGLHPRGLARSIVNLGEVRAYFVGRLERQVALTGDETLAALLQEVAAYPAPEYRHDPAAVAAAGEILTPLMRLRGPDGRELSFFATVATFGTAAEVTTSELSIELAFPADAATAEMLRNLPRR
jgi:transcriptional regulator with XRE-family HTH domain